jgi:hypothetical protein
MGNNNSPAPPAVPALVAPDQNTALAAALNAIAVALTNCNQQQAVAPAHPPVLDPFSSTAPLDLSLRVGSTAFALVCAPLDDPWDGTADTLPSFIISLRIRSSEVQWNALAPQRILTINGHHLITHYHSLTDADITAAQAARTDPHPVQNSHALYKCLKSSVTGDLHATIFDQAGNLPLTEDGPTLFKKLTAFTMVASLQLPMLFFKPILKFDPADHSFNVPTLDTKLNLCLSWLPPENVNFSTQNASNTP